MKNILYITYQENPFMGNKAIIKTQVEELLKVLAEEDNITWLMIYNQQVKIPVLELEAYAEELKKNGIRFISAACKNSNIYTAFFSIEKKLICYLIENKTDIIHCRGYITTLLANICKTKEKVIFDMRGVFPQENRLNKRIPINYIFYYLWNIIEFFNVRDSDKVITVTDYFKTYVLSMHSCREDKVKVIYNCVNTERVFFSSEWRNRIRHELGCEDSYVVVFSGSIVDKWQSFDTISKMYNTISQRMSNTKFILLTRDNRVDFSRYGLKTDNIIVKYVDNSDVYKYLSASDVALLVRNDDIINAVAFPVKFAEYMACGVPVIINGSMKGLIEIINGKGIVYNGDDRILEELQNLKRESCIQFSKEYLDTKIVASKYQMLYQEL